MLAVCERFGCTPLDALRELHHNPHIYHLLAVAAYRDTWRDQRRYDTMSPDQRKHAQPPEGRYADLVARHKLAVAEDAMAASDARKRGDA